MTNKSAHGTRHRYSCRALPLEFGRSLAVAEEGGQSPKRRRTHHHQRTGHAHGSPSRGDRIRRHAHASRFTLRRARMPVARVTVCAQCARGGLRGVRASPHLTRQLSGGSHVAGGRRSRRTARMNDFTVSEWYLQGIGIRLSLCTGSYNIGQDHMRLQCVGSSTERWGLRRLHLLRALSRKARSLSQADGPDAVTLLRT